VVILSLKENIDLFCPRMGAFYVTSTKRNAHGFIKI